MRENSVGIQSNHAHHAHHDDENDRQHNRVLSDVLSVCVFEKLAHGFLRTVSSASS
jgi:hypothetical protein